MVTLTQINTARSTFQQMQTIANQAIEQEKRVRDQIAARRLADPTFQSSNFRRSQLALDLANALRIKQQTNREADIAKRSLRELRERQDIEQGKGSFREQKARSDTEVRLRKEKSERILKEKKLKQFQSRNRALALQRKKQKIEKQRLETQKRVFMQPRKTLIQPLRSVVTEKEEQFIQQKLKVPIIPNVPVEIKDLTPQQLKLLRNAPKNIALGVFEVGKELVLLGRDAVRGSFRYGKTLRKRFETGENNPLSKDVSKLATGTVSVTKFVVTNPLIAASIVGSAGSAIGKDFSKAFIQNPIKTTTKAALYLFPGTVVKGGIKAAGTTAKGLKSVKVAKQLSTLQKDIKLTRTAGLTLSQNNKLQRAVISASKISNKVKQQTKVTTALRSILRERGLNVKKSLSIKQLSLQVRASKTQVPRLIGKGKKPKVPKPKTKKTKIIPVSKLKKAKVDIDKFKVKKVIKKRRKKITRFEVKGKTIKKVTKKKFEKIKPTKKKPVGRPPEQKPVKPVIKTIDVTRLQQKTLQKALKNRGIVKQGDTIFIDLNAVKRIEQTKKVLPVKPMFKSSLLKNKKAQLRFQSQLKSQVSRSVNKVKKVKKSRTVASKNILLKELNMLKLLVNVANVNNIVRLSSLISLIDNAIKETQAVSPAIRKMPAIVQKPIQKLPTQLKKPSQIKKTAQAKKKAKAFKGISKVKTVTPLEPKFPKKISRVKKRPLKPVKVLRLPLKFKNLPKKGSRQGYIVLIKKGNIILSQSKLLLPRFRAINFMRSILDNTLQASGEIIPKGKTSIVDVSKTILSRKFRSKRTKLTKVLQNVEKRKFRFDSKGERSFTKSNRSKPTKTKKATPKATKTKKS